MDILNKNRDCKDSRQKQLNSFSFPKYEAVREFIKKFVLFARSGRVNKCSCSKAELPQEADAVSLSTRKIVQRKIFGRATPSFSTILFMVKQPKNIISELKSKKSYAVNIPVFEHELQDKCVLVPPFGSNALN